MKVCKELFISDSVFIGKVLAAHKVPQTRKWDDGWFYRLSVEKVYRGPKKKHITVFTENNSGRFPLDVGKRYLLFAWRGDDGRLAITSCGNSRPLHEASGVIQEIQTIKTARTGKLIGRVVKEGFWDVGIGGIPFRVVGGGGTWRVSTDAGGWFQVELPPGSYKLENDPSE